MGVREEGGRKEEGRKMEKKQKEPCRQRLLSHLTGSSESRD